MSCGGRLRFANRGYRGSTARMPDESNTAGCLVVIFGASGDLTKRKLVPALYHLWALKFGHKNQSLKDH